MNANAEIESMGSMSSLRFDSTDLGQTEHFISMAYTPMTLSGTAERTRARVTRDAAGSLTVDEISFDFDLTHEARVPMGRVCLCSMRGGAMTRQYVAGTRDTYTAGEVFRYAPHDRGFTGFIEQAHYDLLMFDPVLLDQVAATAPGRRPDRVRIADDRPFSPAAAQQLRNLVSYLREHVLTDPFARTSPLTVSATSQLVAAVVLNVFPSNALIVPTAADRHDAHRATLRRAVAYIDAHAHHPITLADIAEASGTTARAVQAAFRRYRETTPTAYLRQVRLDGAHRDLRAADPASGATVAQIAARWGFADPSRFAGRYRQHFGTSPGRTLHG